MIPIACTILHNFLCSIDDDDEFVQIYLDADNEDKDEDADMRNEDDGGDGLRNEPTPQDRCGMGRSRDTLVQMYAAYQQNLWYKQ